MPDKSKNSKRSKRFLWAWRTAVHKSDLQSSAKLVLLTIGHFMTSQGFKAFPSIELLAKFSSLSDKSVRTAIKKAVEAGFISISSRGSSGGKGWRHYQYTATFPKKEVEAIYNTNGFLPHDEFKKKLEDFYIQPLLGFINHDDINKALPKKIHPHFNDPGFFEDDGCEKIPVLDFLDGFIEGVFFYCFAVEKYGDDLDEVWIANEGRDGHMDYEGVRKIENTIKDVEKSGVRIDLTFKPDLPFKDNYPWTTIEKIPGRVWQPGQ